MPPLNALRAFEAAARLGGFQAAAEELCVTPGAVAQHIRGLEDWLGAELFTRHARGVALTPLGQGVLARFTQAFDDLGRAVQTLRASAGGDIKIAALPAVAQLWLTPRLPALRSGLPGVRISVTALETPPNLSREPFDMALFFGVEGVPLADDALIPVAAPGLGWDAPRLGDATWIGDWLRWCEAMGVIARPPDVLHSLFALAVDEACAGAGVLMGHMALLSAHLADGRLEALGNPLALAAPLMLTSPHDLIGTGPVAQLARLLQESV